MDFSLSDFFFWFNIARCETQYLNIYIFKSIEKKLEKNSVPMKRKENENKLRMWSWSRVKFQFIYQISIFFFSFWFFFGFVPDEHFTTHNKAESDIQYSFQNTQISNFTTRL